MNFNKINSFILLLRPKHWIKNTFVILPLFFSASFYNISLIYQSLIAFLMFSLAASSVYIFNDLIDKDKDIRHPKKKFRPIASGNITFFEANFSILFILLLIFLIGYQRIDLLTVLVGYLILNLTYSLFFKNYAVIDIFIIALGFVMRVYCGVIAINVEISNWILITTFSLALFLASIKRKQELNMNYKKTRLSLSSYTPELINFYINISGISAIIFYSLFAITIKEKFFITIPIVILAFFRYLFLIEVKNKGESPTDALFEDNLFIFILVFWGVVCFCLLI